MKSFLKLFITFYVTVSAAALPAPSDAVYTPGAEAVFKLDHGWEYRFGDSPQDSSGLFEWIVADDSGSEWQKLDDLKELKRGAHQFCWLRIRLPEAEWIDPAILLHGVFKEFQMFLDTRKIYESENFAKRTSDRFADKRWHFIRLPRPLRSNTLYLRIFSDDHAVIGVRYPVFLGSVNGIYHDFFKRSVFRIILGFIYVLLGVFALIIYFVRKSQKLDYVLYLGIFTFLFGIFECFNPAFIQILIPCVKLWYYIDPFSLFLFPVGFFAFTAQIMQDRYQIVFLVFAGIQLLFAIVSFLLDLFIQVSPYRHFHLFLMLLGVQIIIAILVIIRALVKGNPAAKKFRLGIFALALTGLHDVLLETGVIVGSTLLFKWGMFIFIITLFYYLERQFAATARNLEISHAKLEEYSRKLEEYSRKLEEYSHTLEQRVQERTVALQQKNEDLKNAMAQLQNTQQQLVMREKMASLGKLVAGIAHEINNPIGAVNSAADVSTRSLERISATIRKAESAPKLDGINKLFKILQDNLYVITLAGKRIGEIVKSLKNFSRLDQSEFQLADIHEGIESTLTLVSHELKNKVEVNKAFGKIPKIKCYPNQLNQVFMNLLVNTAQAIQDKGELTISTRAEDKNIVISLTDTGKGIPPENLPKIFDPGFTTKGVGVGTGLGLAISYSIIEKHGGEISVESEPGNGTTFTIRLPIN